MPDLLQRASRQYRRRRFPQVIRLLESQIFRFREHPGFFFLLGSACLRAGDLGGAESYLRRADQLRPQDAATQLALAAIHLKRSQTEEALELYLKLVEEHPGNRRALRGLALLRRAAAREQPQLLRDPRQIERLYPALPFNPRVILIPLAAAAAAALLVAGVLLVIPRLPARRAGRPQVREVRLAAGQPALSPTPQQVHYTLTENQVEETFERTKRYLLQYRDNLATREINKILLSNASAYVKEKARLLSSFTRVPDFTTFKDPFTFREVAADPELYAGCYVRWSGKAANVQVGSEAIRFELLVGYENQKELQGVVPVRVGFAVELESGDALEVLGRVELPEGKLALAAVSLHRLYLTK
jgi:tetratricopeptide (TPR) repeat protein